MCRSQVVKESSAEASAEASEGSGGCSKQTEHLRLMCSNDFVIDWADEAEDHQDDVTVETPDWAMSAEEKAEKQKREFLHCKPRLLMDGMTNLIQAWDGI